MMKVKLGGGARVARARGAGAPALLVAAAVVVSAVVLFATASHRAKPVETWAYTYGQEDEDDQLTSIRPTRDGGFIAVGSIVDRKIEEPGLRDAWALKLRSDGSVQWQYAYKMKGLSPLRPDRYFMDGFSDMIELPEGDFIATGATEGQAWLLRTDKTGRPKWLSFYPSPGLGSGLGSIIATNDGNFLAVGSIYGAQNDPTYNGAIWIFRFNENGNAVSSKAYVGPRHPSVTNVVETPQGGTLLAVRIEATMEGQRWGLWLLELREDGTTEWSRFYSGLGFSEARVVHHPNDDGMTLFAIRDIPETEPELKYLGRTRGQRIVLGLDAEGNLLWTKAHDSSDRTKFRPWAREALSMPAGTVLLVGSVMQNVLRGDSHGKASPDVGWLAELDPEKGFLASRAFRLGDTTTLTGALADQQGIVALGSSDIMEGALVMRLGNDLSFSRPCKMDVQGLPDMTVSPVAPMDLKPEDLDVKVVDMEAVGEPKEVAVFKLPIKSKKVCG